MLCTISNDRAILLVYDFNNKNDLKNDLLENYSYLDDYETELTIATFNFTSDLIEEAFSTAFSAGSDVTGDSEFGLDTLNIFLKEFKKDAGYKAHNYMEVRLEDFADGRDFAETISDKLCNPEVVY